MVPSFETKMELENVSVAGDVVVNDTDTTTMMTATATTKRERNFPSLDLSDTTTLDTNTNQPILVIQSPKTPTLSRKLKAVSLDSEPPKSQVTLEVARDVSSMPNTPKKQAKSKQCLDFDDNGHKPTLGTGLGSNLKRFGSNTSISGSQTLKTLPEVMTLQDFSDSRPEPVRIKAKGLLERRGSNASLTIDLGSNSSISEARPAAVVAHLNSTKSASHLNLTSFSADKCACTVIKPSDVQSEARRSTGRFQAHVESCAMYVSGGGPTRTGSCRNRCYTFHKKCNCLCNFKCRRKSLSNENLYVPPCSFCQARLPKDCSGARGARSCKGCRKAVYPRQPDLEPTQLLSEDFKLHLQNIQYLQTAGSVLSVSDLKASCEVSRVPKLHQEFWEVPLNLQEKCLVSGSQSKNRYKGVLPNEHSRVHLPEPHGYIHANYIKGPDYAETAYIATQGPMEHTCEDFWEMIWSAECKCVVMLTGLVEKGKSKCELYFPLGKSSRGNERSYFYVTTIKPRDKFTFDTAGSARNTQQYEEETVEFEEVDELQFGRYRVAFCSRESLGECAIRRLELRRAGHQDRRTLYHYWFSNWQDHKMANPEQVLQIALHILDLVGAAAAPPENDLDNNYLNSDRSEKASLKSKAGVAVADADDSISITNSSKPSSVAGGYRNNKKLAVQGKARRAQRDKAPRSPRRLKTATEVTRLPVVVHCSAGIGRTGCFLAILNGIQQLRNNFNVDVLAILCSLRLNRGGMVQTAEQYELIHRVLNLYAEMIKM